ncbi:MAG: zf-TFIIB domain-containing protein [Thermoleophilia bacterium]
MTGPETVRCPNDDGDLRPVASHNRQGVPITLDQCDGCGGLWFDKFELFQIDEKDASLLARIDKTALRRPMGASDQPHCPRCGAALERFTDPNIPANIQMLMCGVCEGFWLNHGALADFAALRQSRHPAVDPALAAEYEKTLAASSEAEKWEGVLRLGHELGGARDILTGMPLDGSPRQLEKIDAAHEAAFGTLRTIMRLLFSI